MPQTDTMITLGEFGGRARPLREDLREAALVIGLGAVGLQAVARIHTMLGVMLTRRDLQNNVKLMAIARQRTMREEMVLPREERLILKQDRLNWSEVPGRYATLGVAQWWPHSPRAREVMDDPTQIRAFNRLILYENAQLVSESLFKLMQWLHAAGTHRSDIKLAKRVYLVGSIAEAEGSGMIFDVASRLRALARNEPIQIISLLSLRADIPDDPEHVTAMANVYATLREIDSYTSLPDTFTSNLPVIGHSLSRTTPPRRALDLILLADDANVESIEPPELLLAEGVTTWIGSSLLPPDKAATMPDPIAYESGGDRFIGYSTFGVSKLSLPTRTAMDLAASGLARASLLAIKAPAGPSGTWVNQIITALRTSLASANILQAAPDVSNKVREWDYDLSSAGLIRHLEARAARGESNRMSDQVQSEWRRLELDILNARMTVQHTDYEVPDNLRTRVDAALAVHLRPILTTLEISPVELACAKGLGVYWAMSALEELEQQLRNVVFEHQRETAEANAACQLARKELFEAAQQYDSRGGGRGKKGGTELDQKGQAALQAATLLVLSQAELDIWQMLITMTTELRTQVKDVLPLIDPMVTKIRELETSSGERIEELAQQTPRYPSAVLFPANWYENGTRDIASFTTGHPRELLSKVYSAWAPGDLPPDRWLTRFISEVLDAARRALAGVFQFGDLYDALKQVAETPLFQPMMNQLPGTANPALLPMADEKHAPPTPYELVREQLRPVTAVPAAARSVRRSTIPSPDPDEICVMRVLHGIMAEALPPLREGYRRAYDRAGAEGMSLHIDRRWDATMADLVHTSARREISVIWENLLIALQKQQGIQAQLEGLIRSFGVALNVESVQIAGFDLPSDMRLVVYKMRPFRLKLPPPHCAVLFLYSNRTSAELGDEILRAISPLALEVHFAFVVNINGRPDIDEIVEPLRRVDYTVLVLNEADVKHLIAARQPTLALNDLILHKVSLTTVSPFFTRGPVPERMFFGREHEINEVKSKLREHSVALIGGRRIGKTSTLQRLEQTLKADDSEYTPIYLDCHGATTYRSFFWLLNKRWQVNIAPDADPVEFEDVITELQIRHPRKKLVILFDEIDSLLVFDRKPENMETLFRTIRSLSNEKRCQYIFSGEKWLMRSIANSQSAFFNFVKAVRLEPLPPKTVHHLVAEPLELLNIWMENADQIIDRIYKISAGHPNIVQMICQAMVEELGRKENTNLLTYDELELATSRRTLQEEIVLTIWGQMNPLARLITLLWPEDVRFLTLTEIGKMVRKAGLVDVPPDRLEKTAIDLELYCFVRRQSQDTLELIPMAFPAILDFMTDKRRQIEIVLRQYAEDPDGVGVVS